MYVHLSSQSLWTVLPQDFNINRILTVLNPNVKSNNDRVVQLAEISEIILIDLFNGDASIPGYL